MRLALKGEKAERLLKTATVVLMAACAALFLYTVVRYKPKPTCMEILPYPIALVVLCALLRGDYGKRPAYWLAAGFVAWFGVTRLLVGDIYGRQAFYYFAEVAIVYLFALPFARVSGDAQRRRVFDALALGVAAVVTAACILGLCVVIGGRSISFPGGLYTTELIEGRLWIMALNPNISAVFMAIAILLVVYLLLRYRKKWMCAVGAAAIAVNYLALVATDSRTSKLSLLACVAVTAAAIASKCFRRRFRGRTVAVTVVAAAVVLAFYFGFSLATQALNGGAAAYAEWRSEAAQTVSGQQTDAQPEEESAAAEIVERALVNEGTSGRDLIYRCFRNYLKDNPSVLYKGASNLTIRLMSCYGMQDIASYMKIHLHNSFLQTLAATGLPGLGLTLAICAVLLVQSVRVLFSRKRSAAEKMLPVLLLFLIVNSAAECPLFVPYDMASNSFSNFFFFLCAGYVVELGRESRAECRETEESIER